MNRTLILLVLFLLLGGGAFYMLQNQDNLSTTSHRTDGDFAVENVDEIQKIFIADRKDYKVLLERKKGHWTYNKEFKARQTAIDDLLSTIKGIRMKYTTPRGAEKPMIENLAIAGVKVEIYGKNDKKLKTYYVGGTTANSLGTYMIMEGSSEPYVTHIPTFQGMLRGKFMKQPDDWKDLMLFGESVEEIEFVSVEYPKQRNKSFKLEKSESGSFSVNPFYEASPKIDKPILQGAVEKYLSGFKGLQAESFSNGDERRDSMSQTLPFVTISVKNNKGEMNVANFYPIVIKDEFGNPVAFLRAGMKNTSSIARYFVDYTDGSFRMVQHKVFEHIFWSYDYFFKK